MRHLSVPCKETSLWIQKLRGLGWLANSVSVTKLNEFERAIPLSDETPDILPALFKHLSIIELEISSSKNKHYIDNLEEILGKEIVQKYDVFWPKSYDQIGDLIIFKLNKEVQVYSGEISTAMLERNPKSRIVLLDGGVTGIYRIRKLTPLVFRDSEAQKIQKARADISTKTVVKENGFEIIVDPQKAYYSPRLSNERMGTLDTAINLAKKLERPLNIIDPYAGAGPSIIPLICEKGLVNKIYASDINPQAVNLLKENIEKHTKKKFNQDDEIEDYAKIEVVDARTLSKQNTLFGKFDMILVNIPHSSLEHLHNLFSLLSFDKVSLIRGWALINDTETTKFKAEINQQIRDFNNELDTKIIIERLKSYSVDSIFVRFEIYFESN